MDGEEHPARVAVRRVREETLEQLSTAFADDEIGLEELEQRVDRAYAVASVPELEALTSDLSARNGRLRARVAIDATDPVPATVRAAPVPVLARPRHVRAVLGNLERRGRFPLEDGAQVTAVLGNVELDLREVALPPGTTTVRACAARGAHGAADRPAPAR